LKKIIIIKKEHIMKNEEKDKRYVYIRMRDICIIGVIIIVLSLLWNFRDKVETLLLNNHNEAKYISISSLPFNSNGKINYLDKDGKVTKVVSKDLYRGYSYIEHNGDMYISNRDNNILKIGKDGSLKDFEIIKKEGLSKDNRGIYVNRICIDNDKMYMTHGLVGKTVIYVKDMTGKEEGKKLTEIPYNITNMCIIKDEIILTADKLKKSDMIILDKNTGEIKKVNKYDEHIKTYNMSKDNENNIYVVTLKRRLSDQEMKNSKEKNEELYDSYISKLNIYNNTIEDILVDGKKVRGSLIRIEDKNMYIYDDKEDKFKVIDLKENKEVFSEKITGNIRSTYFKDDKLYMNIWENHKTYMYIYDVKTNKMIEKKEFKVDEKRDNMIFSITK
jgi:hypothetical protein